MEFGFFTQGYVPEAMRRDDPDAEHTVFMDDLEVCQAADEAGFKYVWVTEHHFLDEYSHLSANDVVARLPRARRPSASTSARASSTRCPR